MSVTVRDRMLELLSDGQPHSKIELHSLCGPSSINVVKAHICHMRKDLRPYGKDILIAFQNNKCFYRLVRLLAPADAE